MSDQFKIVKTHTLNPTGKVLIQAFTGSGLVASIVSHHLIDQLGLSEKAYISSSLIPSVGIVRDGIIHRPVRIYENKDYILVLSEVGIKQEDLVEFTENLYDWYTEFQPSRIIIIGALPTGRPADADDLRYTVVASDEQTQNFLMDKGIWTMPDGAVYGSVALSLMEAKRSGIGSFAVLSNCIATIPDYLAAKKVVEILSVVLDNKIPTKVLDENAKQLKSHLIEREMDKSPEEDDYGMDGFDLYDDQFEFDDSHDDEDEDDDLSAFI